MTKITYIFCVPDIQRNENPLSGKRIIIWEGHVAVYGAGNKEEKP